jgi:hypothetical protein
MPRYGKQNGALILSLRNIPAFEGDTMILKSCSLLLAAALIAAPMGAAMAQQGANNSPRAAPNSPRMDSSSAATNPNVPGATGQTVVPGSSSSMAGSHRVVPNPDSAATTASGGGSK